MANTTYTAAGSYEGQEKLPLSEHYQHAVLGWMESDYNFFRIVIERIEPSWFINPGDVLLFKLYREFYKRTKKHPEPYVDETLPGDLMSCSEFLSQDQGVRKTIRKAFFMARAIAQDNSRPEKVYEELEEWLKARTFHKLLHESTTLYNKGKFADSYASVRSNLVSLEQATFGASAVENLEIARLTHEREVEQRGAISFGNTLIDSKLVETNIPQGGLLPGDTTVLLAPVNVGKTTTMLTVAAHNVAVGKKVITTTHEGRALDIKTKFWCSLLRCKRTDLDEMWAKNVVVQGHDMRWWQDHVNKHWTFVPLYGKNIEETITIVRSLHEAKKSEPGAKTGYDLWVDDYPGTITTIQATSGKLSRRERDEVVYGQVVDLAGELKLHALCAIQSNREGAKINKGTSKDHHNRLLTMEDVSESYGPMMRATNVISLNRDPVAMQKGIVTFYICKSRSSRTGIAVTCRSRYDLACTHANDDAEIYNGGKWGVAGFAYEGTEAFSEKAEGFLEAYPNGEVPYGEVLAAMSAG